MDVKVENLIERLKREGVEEARKEAEAVLAQVRKQADDLLAEARKQAEGILAQAGTGAENFKSNAERAVRQAVRDGELLMKSRIIALFDSVFKREVRTALDPGFLKDLILKTVESWKPGAPVDVTLAPADLDRLEALGIAELKKSTPEGIQLEAGRGLAGGFRIGRRDEHLYYDFSDESIAGILRSFLNPRLLDILDRKNG